VSAGARRRFVLGVAGLALEARIARGKGVRVVAAGGTGRLEDMLAREIGDGAAAIISFGIAGGLVDGLRAGTCIIGRRVMDRGANRQADPGWVVALAERVAYARIADVAGSDRVVTEPADKRELHRTTGASIVDTESHVVARVAQENDLPFAVFRVVCDPAERPVAAAAHAALGSAGEIRVLDVLQSLARSPAQVGPLARLAMDAGVAVGALLSARRRLGTGLAYPNLDELLLDVL
jgi:adenosylhomocysteine nucleosidase